MSKLDRQAARAVTTDDFYPPRGVTTEDFYPKGFSFSARAIPPIAMFLSSLPPDAMPWAATVFQRLRCGKEAQLEVIQLAQFSAALIDFVFEGKGAPE